MLTKLGYRGDVSLRTGLEVLEVIKRFLYDVISNGLPDAGMMATSHPADPFTRTTRAGQKPSTLSPMTAHA